ncbi:alpha box protein [Marssonina coronariae]|uniref:Alpha box protein n=1 Tax=Diplocarpon coronariae TaxID=2795749 RepID=A0A218YXR2_9HELO|nr:alpha box protein [Marssonina coronariae]QRL06102.1 MAT1-1-1 [Marssonina coronariae]
MAAAQSSALLPAIETAHSAHRTTANTPAKITEFLDGFQMQVLPYIPFAAVLISVAFYQNLFPHLQQKEASTYLTTLWKRDPFKAKWTVIAAAYSKIRDAVGKPRAPLDKYMSVVCPQMGIIAVPAYLGMLHWTYERPADGAPTLTQSAAPDLQALDQHILRSNMTAQDLISFCGRVGYIPRSIARRLGGQQSSGSPQHGLLASTPDLGLVPLGGREERREPAVASRPADLPLAPSDGWTGSMSDLYHPSEGSVDFERLLSEPHASAWDTVSIYEPASLDRLLESGGVADGFLAPCVPQIGRGASWG